MPVSDLTDTQRAALTQRYIAAAREYFPKRAAHFQQFTGGTYNRITIRDQKTTVIRPSGVMLIEQLLRLLRIRV